MIKEKIVNKNRSKLFGVVINPKLDEKINWRDFSILEINSKLRELKFINKFLLMDCLNNLEVENVSKNKTYIKDFAGQLELGTKNKIPHYQLAIEMNSICTKKKILESLENKINGHISVDIQFDMKNMKEYCTKSFKGENEILPEYSSETYIFLF